MIQKVIRTEFKDVTVITVAHRLQTVMDSDKIVSPFHSLFIFKQLCLRLATSVTDGS